MLSKIFTHICHFDPKLMNNNYILYFYPEINAMLKNKIGWSNHPK